MANPILVYHPGGRVLAEPLTAPPSVSTFTVDEDESGVSLGNPTPILDYQPTYGGPIFSSDELPRQGYRFYWPGIENLIGGNEDTDLDGQPIYILPADSLVTVVIDGRGESHWLRVTDATSPVTDTNAGIITPTSYDADSRPYILHREIGF